MAREKEVKMKSNVEIVSKRLQYHLKEKNLTVYAFAKMIGKKSQGVYRIVMGKNKRYISEKVIEEYAEALGLNTNDLLTPLPDYLDDPPKEQKKI